MIYHFGPGPRLESTLGPLIGALPPEAETTLLADDNGARWLVSDFGDLGLRVRRFDSEGWPADVTPIERREFDQESATPALRPEPASDGSTEAMRGDLDGDGQLEVVSRRLH